MKTKKTKSSSSLGVRVGEFGYCPWCGGSALIRYGQTTNTGSEKQRYLCKGCGKSTTAPLKEPKSDGVVMRNSVPVAKRYIITAAQNATPIHRPTWLSLLFSAKYF